MYNKSTVHCISSILGSNYILSVLKVYSITRGTKVLQEFYFADWQFLFYVGPYICYKHVEQRPICPAIITLLWFLVPPNSRALNHTFAILVNHPFKKGGGFQGWYGMEEKVLVA